MRAPGAGRTGAVTVAWAVLGCVVLGAALGLAWWRLAPPVALFVAGGRAYPSGYQPGGFVAADGIFAGLAVAAGLVVAGILLARHPARPLLVLAAGVLGGVAGSLVLWWVGTRLGASDAAAVAAQSPDGTELTAALRVRMPGVLLLWPVASAAVVTMAAAWAWLRGRGDDDPPGTVAGPPRGAPAVTPGAPPGPSGPR